jgi:hypothetical protein
MIPNQLRDKFLEFEICLSDDASVLREAGIEKEWEIDDNEGTYIIRGKNGRVEVFERADYKGIVVFGFKNRAKTTPRIIVHFPSYAEHDLEYLIILAHEAYHLTFSETLRKSAFELKSMQNNIKIGLQRNNSLVSLYIPETLKDKNTPEAIIAEELADEIMADIYATIVAGEAYPMVLGKYYLPVMLDTKGSANPPYSSFVIGSLKMRISLLTLVMMKWKSPLIKEIIQYTEEKIKYWESISKRIAFKKI